MLVEWNTQWIKSPFNRLVQFIDYINQCPRTGEDWIGNFNTFFTQNKIAEADRNALMIV